MHNRIDNLIGVVRSYDDFFKDAFERGAQWRINSVWHQPNEKPENGKIVLCVRGGGGLALISGPNNSQFRKYSYEYGFDYWAYVEDLLPTALSFDEILEANKDVLKRLKEKGD